MTVLSGGREGGGKSVAWGVLPYGGASINLLFYYWLRLEVGGAMTLL